MGEGRLGGPGVNAVEESLGTILEPEGRILAHALDSLAPGEQPLL